MPSNVHIPRGAVYHASTAHQTGAPSSSCPPWSSSSFVTRSGHMRFTALNPDLLLSPWLLQITPAARER